MEIKATGLPETIEDYQVALNAAFAGGKAYGLAQRTWVELTVQEVLQCDFDDTGEFVSRGQAKMNVAAKLKEKNNA